MKEREEEGGGGKGGKQGVYRQVPSKKGGMKRREMARAAETR